MNPLSINERNIDYYHSEFKKRILDQANRGWLFKHYKVGENLNKYKVLHSIIFSDIICTQNCDIITYLNKRLTDLSDPHHKHKPFDQKLKAYCEKHNCSESEACSNIISSQW